MAEKFPLLTVELKFEQDLVLARQRARQAAGLLGLDQLAAMRVAAAVSEIARNALLYAGGGRADIGISGSGPGLALEIIISDKGPGIKDLDAVLDGRATNRRGRCQGIVNARRLLGHFHIETTGAGTAVTLCETLPHGAARPDALPAIKEELLAAGPSTPYEEIKGQNQALQQALDELRQKKEELAALNQELTETNKGIIAMHTELVNSNRELEAFSYSVSHDLRAPLRHASGYVDLLVSRFREGLPEQALHYLDCIAGSVSQMGQLIDDLLRFSRTSRAELRLAPADMNAVVAGALEPLKTAAAGRAVDWALGDFPPALCDAALLGLVWTNLLSNALKFTRKTERARIEAGCRREGNEMVFFVKDNGAGFDMGYAKNLFGVFQRLHTQEDFEGTGIGLANVKRIVQRHGGRVWAEAEPGKGAAFYFTLPEVRQGGADGTENDIAG